MCGYILLLLSATTETKDGKSWWTYQCSLTYNCGWVPVSWPDLSTFYCYCLLQPKPRMGNLDEHTGVLRHTTVDFPFQPVVHNWFIKGRGMYCSVYGKVHIKDPLLLIEKSSLCGGSGFPSKTCVNVTIWLTSNNRW